MDGPFCGGSPTWQTNSFFRSPFFVPSKLSLGESGRPSLPEICNMSTENRRSYDFWKVCYINVCMFNFSYFALRRRDNKSNENFNALWMFWEDLTWIRGRRCLHLTSGSGHGDGRRFFTLEGTAWVSPSCFRFLLRFGFSASCSPVERREDDYEPGGEQPL